jgi:uncharacterized membrane protein YqiK
MKMLFGFTPEMTLSLLIYVGGGIAGLIACYIALGIRYIANHAVGIVEKLWSPVGPVAEGRLIVLDHEAGYRANVLRGGFYFLYWIWQFRMHWASLTIIPQGKIGYVFAHDGESLKPEQTLGRVVPYNNFQDAKAVLTSGKNEKGRGQRGIRWGNPRYIRGGLPPNLCRIALGCGRRNVSILMDSRSIMGKV